MAVINWKKALVFNKKRVPAGKLGPSFKWSDKKRIYLNDRLRLVSFDYMRKESVAWYQDEESMKSIVGKSIIYDEDKITQMYDWQNKHGELFYIEYLVGDTYRTIGDVWLAKNDYAIVIDRRYRNRHIGRTVTKYFIYKARMNGWETMYVSEIFNWNKASQKMFTSLKFYPFKEHRNSWSYRRRLKIAEKNN
ncbi:GNAT family N-acetyltransferase [uncultured Enterococcus sp.]|uniref:GNAT family N-acetyltransferase n=1 Tax=uncultured Enterococcus sp. TaxID=167972 RepID=UPI002AA619A4|nr:GNAT family N-acetyltransferase [uncultured Enterococcus sp.]